MSKPPDHGPTLAGPAPLVAGERLDQPTFHARYEAMPPGIRCELIGGVVHMPSPVRYEHSEADHMVAGWFFHYGLATPHVSSGINATTILGDDSEPQPDQYLRIDAARGGAVQVVDGFLVGPPELIVEVAKTTRATDLGDKKDDYERAGVREYVFVGIDPDEVRWFALEADRYVERLPGADGLFRSQVFPGLWLDPLALFRHDRSALIAALERGLATPEHAAFVARLTGDAPD